MYFSMTQKSLSLTLTGGGDGFAWLGIMSGFTSERTLMWKILWIFQCDGSSRWYVKSESLSRIQKGLCHLLVSFGEGSSVTRFVASSHTESLTLKLGLLHFPVTK
jgi:hypothetical protein